MTGIAGWADFTAGVRRDRAAGCRMIGALAHRGSGEPSVWEDRLASLACRDGGGADPQPRLLALAEDSRPGVALCYDGWLDNSQELRRSLSVGGAWPEGTATARFMLEAYLEWGDYFAERLMGEYALALWDSRREEFLLVRDRLGVKPLYYAMIPGGVAFGSEPAAIFAHGSHPAVVTAEGLRELLAPARAFAASVWQGVREVPAGTVLRIGRGGCAERRYWRLRAGQPSGDATAAAAELRGLLEDVVARQLGAPPAACLLSGGLDSSALTVLAARQLSARGDVPLRTHTLDFDGYAENFRADSARPTPDAPFARDVAKHVGADHDVVSLSVADLTNDHVRDVVWNASDRLPSQCDLTRGLYAFYQRVRVTSPVVLSGEGADELLGMGPVSDAASVAPGVTFPWLAWLGGMPRFSFLRPDLERRLGVDEHVRGLYQAALAECPRWPGDSPHDSRMRESIFLYTIHDMSRTLERADRLGAASSLQVRMPFLDHRVIELTFNAGYQPHTFDGREKSLLRAAVADLLPPSVLSREKSNLPTPQDAAYDATIERDYLDLLAAKDAPVAEFADRRALDLLAKSAGGRTSVLYLRRMRENVLAFDSWLRAHGASLRL